MLPELDGIQNITPYYLHIDVMLLIVTGIVSSSKFSFHFQQIFQFRVNLDNDGTLMNLRGYFRSKQLLLTVTECLCSN